MFDISEGLLLGLLIIPILAILIIAHELGHFFAARSVGVTVEEFGIGLPPRAKGWRWKGVLWSLNWIPFGGFVRVKGEDASDVSPDSMNAKAPLQRAWFLVAGPLMNFVVAILLSFALIAFQGIPSEASHIYIGQVAADSPAAGAGWQPGDAIVAVGGEEITSASQLQSLIRQYSGEETTVTILRGGETIETTVTPRKNPPANQGATGITMGEGINSIVKFTEVEAGSPAEAAGLRTGDVLVAVDGVTVDSHVQAQSLLQNAQGSTVPVVVKRDGAEVALTLAIPATSIVVTGVGTDTPAEDAQLFRGDRLTAIDGEAITDGTSLQTTLLDHAGQEVTVTVDRVVTAAGGGTETRAIDVTLAIPEIADDENPLTVIGINAGEPSVFSVIGTDAVVSNVYEDVSLGQIVPQTWDQFWSIVTGTYDGVGKIVTGEVSTDQLTGPIGMGQLTSEVLSSAATPMWVSLAQIMMVISISLGAMNLLPLPALDGGRLLFVLIEILRGGKKIAPEKEGMVHLTGMVILLGLMFFVAFGDVSRLFDGSSIIP